MSEKERCTYCEREVDHGDEVPDGADDERWDEIAEQHEEWCDWILSRAHRIDLYAEAAEVAFEDGRKAAKEEPR